MATAKELTQALVEGRVSLRAVVRNFRERRWPDSDDHTNPNSFAAVQADSRLTDAQHAALYAAWKAAPRHPQ